MYISDQKKFVFIHIPKNAGTTVKKIILPFVDINKYTIEGEQVTKTGKYMSHQKMNQADALKFKEYYKFAIVRNPWSRHVSYWHFKCRTKSDFKQMYPTFTKYIKSLSKIHKKYKELTWNQASWIYDQKDNLLVDYVAKFEDLGNELEKICTQLDIELDSENIPHYKDSQVDDYREFYTPETRDIVAKINARDIRLFNYQF